MHLGALTHMAETRTVAAAFDDGRIKRQEARQIVEIANGGRPIRRGDDLEALAQKVAQRINQASSGRISEADAQAAAQTIVREVYETVVPSSGNGRFDTIQSPFSPVAFIFPDHSKPPLSEQEQDELLERIVTNDVKDRTKPATVAQLQNPATRKNFLERCTQLDGNTKTVWDRSACAVISTLGGYILADPKSFQRLGAALRQSPLPQIPGFDQYRRQHPELQTSLNAIAKGRFAPMDVLTVGRALATLHGVRGPDYAKGTDDGMSLNGALLMVQQLTAAGAPPPEGLTLVGVEGHQVARVGGENGLYFDSQASRHVSNGHKANHAVVADNLNYMANPEVAVELVFSQGGQKAEFHHRP